MWVPILYGVLYAILVDEALTIVVLATELWVIFALELVLVVAVLVVDFVELNISSLTVDRDFVLEENMIVLLLSAGCFVEVLNVAVCVVIVLEASAFELLSSVSSFEVVVFVSVVLSVKGMEGKVEDVVVC